MKDRLKVFIALVCGFAIPLLSSAQGTPAQSNTAKHHHYKLIDLGTLGGPQSVIFETATRALNQRGTVAYIADTANFDPNNPQNPIFLYPDGYFDPYIQHVVQWRNGKQTDLGALPGGTSSYLQWINDRGMVVGGSTNGVIDPLTGYPETVAILWEDGKVYNLGTLGGNESGAYSLNNLGQVVGWASNTIPDEFTTWVFAQGATQAHATFWKNGVIEDLGTLGGPDSVAVFVNDLGQVAGQSLTSFIPNASSGFPTQDPFLWENGKMIDLGTLGGTNGYPYALNNRGQVVGISNLAGDQNWHAFLWDRGVLKACRVARALIPSSGKMARCTISALSESRAPMRSASIHRVRSSAHRLTVSLGATTRSCGNTAQSSISTP